MFKTVCLYFFFSSQIPYLSQSNSRLILKMKIWKVICEQHITFGILERKYTTKILGIFNKNFYYIAYVLNTYLREWNMCTKYAV